VVPLQLKKTGDDAKGFTAAERAHVLAQLRADVARKMEEDPDAFPLGYYIISEDNCKQHAPG